MATDTTARKPAERLPVDSPNRHPNEESGSRPRFLGFRSFGIYLTPFRLTQSGWVVAFLLVWLPLASFGSANNFLLIMFIMLVGLIYISHTMAVRNLFSVTVVRRFPEEIFADTLFPLHYLVRSNLTPWGASTLRFEEAISEKSMVGDVSFSHVPPGEATDITGFCTIPKRGDAIIYPGKLSSSFPFGLARYVRSCGESQAVLVFPKIEPVADAIPYYFGGSRRGVERADPFGTVPFHFREYIPGDPHKHIEWKKSARTGTLISKVLSEESAGEVTIRLPRDASERAISRAASLVVHFSRLASPVSLHGPGFSTGPGTGKDFSRTLLTILARWEEQSFRESAVDRSSGSTVSVDAHGNLRWESRGEADVHV
jgi:uncharacterized protein (DUF58 family)